MSAKSFLSRFLDGLRLPLALVRTVWRDPEARRYYKRVMIVQVSITVIVGLSLAIVGFAGMLAAKARGMDVTFSSGTFTFHSGAVDAPPPGGGPLFESPLSMIAGFGSLLFGTLTLIETLVVVLSRDYHDQIGRRAALLSGVAPEDPEKPARVRLNLRWLWTKTKRRFRGLRVFVAGLPVLGLVTFVPLVGSYFYAAVAFAWSFYWLTVFAGAKSAQAWHDEETATDPFFLRAASRVPIVKWYARLWRRLTRAVFAPCRRVEEAPFELAGLAVVRLIGTVPVFYLFVRPFLPVAAATIIARRNAERVVPGSGGGRPDPAVHPGRRPQSL